MAGGGPAPRIARASTPTCPLDPGPPDRARLPVDFLGPRDVDPGPGVDSRALIEPDRSLGGPESRLAVQKRRQEALENRPPVQPRCDAARAIAERRVWRRRPVRGGRGRGPTVPA